MNSSDSFISNIIFNYLKRSNYAVDYKNLKLQLQSNPDYPSVKSITDTLDYFNVDNIAANVPKDALEQLPNMFLAIIVKDHKTSIAQVEIKKGFVTLLDSNGKKEKLSIPSFKDIWNGTIIAIEKNFNGVKNNINSASILNHPIIPFVLIAVISIFSSMIHFNGPSLIYTITSAIGLLIGYFIVREAIGLFSQSTSKVCNSSTNNTSCGEVINSVSSKLFGLVSLSDLTITYFLTLLITLPTSGYNATFFLVLSILSLPIIGYTIYQQAVAIKKWCPLCLVVSFIILLQATITFITFNSFIININYSISCLFIFVMVYVSWSQLKTLIVENIQLNQEATIHLKFKRNEKLFNTLLEEEPIAEPIHLNENALLFGNPIAKLTINAITNPLCGFCTKAFQSYHKMLQKYPDDIKLNIIFNVPSDNLEQASSQIAQRIIELYQENRQEAFLALHDWFNVRDVAKWQATFGIADEKFELNTLKAHKETCNSNDISYTPATIINNHKYPKAYQIEDLSFFMDSLTDKDIKKEPSVT